MDFRSVLDRSQGPGDADFVGKCACVALSLHGAMLAVHVVARPTGTKSKVRTGSGGRDRTGIIFLANFSVVMVRFFVMIATVARRVPLWESLLTGVGMAAVIPWFALMWRRHGGSAGIVPIFSLVLSVVGASITTIAEYQRAQHPPNTLFRDGLFAYASHINYSGEVLLWIGFALQTKALKAQVVPAAFFISFLYFYVPNLDAHLERKYPNEFALLAQARTPKLVPFGGP